MVSIGMIHMECNCGAELFYLGNKIDGKPPLDLIDSFTSKLEPGDYGIFTSADGVYGECPHCGILIELPDPDLMDWLPFADEKRFEDLVTEVALTTISTKGGQVNGSSMHQNIV